MTDITAISVVVARMIPSSVRKLRSLLPRSEASATLAASCKDARFDMPATGDGFQPIMFPIRSQFRITRSTQN